MGWKKKLGKIIGGAALSGLAAVGKKQGNKQLGQELENENIEDLVKIVGSGGLF